MALSHKGCSAACVADSIGHLIGVDENSPDEISGNVVHDLAQLVLPETLDLNDASQMNVARTRQAEPLRADAYAPADLRDRFASIVERVYELENPAAVTRRARNHA